MKFAGWFLLGVALGAGAMLLLGGPYQITAVNHASGPVIVRLNRWTGSTSFTGGHYWTDRLEHRWFEIDAPP